MLPSAIMPAAVGVVLVLSKTGLLSWGVPDQQPCKGLWRVVVKERHVSVALGGSSWVNLTSVAYLADKEKQLQNDLCRCCSFRECTLEIQTSRQVWDEK